MPKMRAIDAAVRVLEKGRRHLRLRRSGRGDQPALLGAEGAQSIRHILARHVEGASHMAEGYTRAKAGNIGVCIGTSGPAGTDMITGLYSAQRRLDPDPLHHRPGAARAALQGRLPGRRYRVDRQARHQMGGHGARAGAGAAGVPAGLPPDALGPSGPGADRPADRRADSPRSNSTIDTYEPLPVYKPAATRKQIEKALDDAERRRAAADRGGRRHHQCRRQPTCWCEFAETHRRAGDPDADGLGRDSRRSPADGRHGAACRPATATATPRCSRPTSCSASATAGPTATPARSRSTPRAASSCTSTSSRRRSAACSVPISASSPTPRPRSNCSSRWRRNGRPAGKLKDRGAWAAAVPGAQAARCCARAHFDDVPIKPQRVYEEMNEAFGRDTCYVSDHRPVADRRRAVPARLQAAQLDQLRPGRPAGLDDSGGARRARGRSGRARSSRCRATTTSSS